MIKNKEIVLKNKDIWDKIMPKYLELEKLKKDFLDKDEKLKIKKEELKLFLPKYEDSSIKYRNLENEYKLISEYEYTINEIMKKLDLLEKLEKLKRELEENKLKILYCDLVEKRKVLDDIKKYHLEIAGVNELKNKLILVKDNYVKRNDKYIKAYERFLNAQAGILALTLKEGEACPVCGNIEHPCLANVVDDVLSKEELDSEKIKLEMLYQEVNKISFDLNTKEKEVFLLKKEFASIDYDTLNNDIQNLERQCNGIYVHEEDFHDLIS